MYYNNCKTNHTLNDVIETIGNNITNFDPIRGFKYFNDNFPEFLNGASEAFKSAKNTLSAKLDILEDDNVYEVIMELPCINKKDVKILAKEENSLEIEATKEKPDFTNENKKIIYQERGFGNVTRTINFSKQINKENISAKWQNGELIIIVPKLKPADPVEIKIAIK